MTYRELYESATRKLEKSEITLGEYEEMTKPLNEDVRTWIPCSERLPQEIDYCLCCDKDGYMTIGYISKWSKEWCFDDDEIDIDVVAWMPLPKPYEPKERSE